MHIRVPGEHGNEAMTGLQCQAVGHVASTFGFCLLTDNICLWYEAHNPVGMVGADLRSSLYVCMYVCMYAHTVDRENFAVKIISRRKN